MGSINKKILVLKGYKMKIGDIVKVQKYHQKNGMYKRRLVNKRVIDIKNNEFAYLIKTKNEVIKIWQDINNYKDNLDKSVC